MEVNATGAKWMAEAAHRLGSAMFYVSTDYVFDGESTRPYREDDEPHPVSRYGLSKHVGEREVMAACPDAHVIVRTAWLYGDGAGFVDWVCRGLDCGETLRLVADHRGSPTYAADLADALLRLAEQGRRGVYHFANRGETSWLDWGRTTAELTGHPDVHFDAVAADDLGRAAPRPRYSVLAVDKYEKATGCRVPTWQNALKRYLESTTRLR
jgi:dTDP-4-dehydrorhamnose reductase